ncbi:extracellular solute-binding protein [Hydrogenoanaerobacterium sp.]|uniref:ABC transporter substrate-binding protein n=1 Tax=Hydrogenoanaerobacterium sp. TaxID=2953763 RepID=UPI00289714A4|nr:extracellular solute-binding protein [Hydrogenoanaerobacterium sp.]
MKKLLSVVLSVILVSTLAACSGGNVSQAPSPEAPKPETSASEAAPAEKEKIVVWAWDKNFNIAAMEEAKKVYTNLNPNVEIEIVEFAQSDIIQKLNTGLGSGSADDMPNIVLIEDYRSQTFLKSFPGSFRDLTGKVNHKDFANFKLGFMTIDGKCYGVPFDAGTTALFYRKDLIEQAGYTEADMQDMTWDKYIEIGKAVKEKTGKYMLTLDPNDMGQLRIMMQTAGEWYVKPDGAIPNFEGNKALEESAEIYKSMMDSGISKTISEWAQFVGAANGGEVATVPTGCWFTASIAAEASQSGQWRVAPIPRLSKTANSVNASNLGGSSWYVLDKVPGGDTAVDFLAKTFGSDTEFYQTLLTNVGAIGTYTPAQSGAAYDTSVEFFGGQKIYKDISSWTSKIPSVNYGLHTYAFEDIMKAEMQNVMSGTPVQTALANAQKQAEAQIQ